MRGDAAPFRDAAQVRSVRLLSLLALLWPRRRARPTLLYSHVAIHYTTRDLVCGRPVSSPPTALRHNYGNRQHQTLGGVGDIGHSGPGATAQGHRDVSNANDRRARPRELTRISPWSWSWSVRYVLSTCPVAARLLLSLARTCRSKSATL